MVWCARLRPSKLCENEYGKAASFDSVSGWHVCHLGGLQAPAVRYREIRGTVQEGSWIVKYPLPRFVVFGFYTRRQESVRDIAKKIQEKKALEAAQSGAAADTALPGAGDYGTGSSASNTSAQ